MNHVPFLLVFHITGRCNLNCAYCYANSYDKNDVHLEELKDVLNQAKNLGSKHVILSGGEPLIHPNFNEIVEHTVELGIQPHITSNGVFINEECVDILQSLNAVVTISLDGSCPDVNDPLRGGGTFKAALDSIDKLVNAGVYTSMRMTLTRMNVNDVPNYLELANYHDVDRCIIERITPIKEIPQSFVLEPSIYDLRRAFEDMYKYKERYKNFIIGSNDPLWLLLSENIAEKHKNRDYVSGGCTAGVAAISVNPDLTVNPCPRLPINIGSLKNSSLEEIWNNSDFLKNLRDRNIFHGCSSCPDKYMCGGCRGAAHAHGHYLGVDPQCWRIRDELCNDGHSSM